MQNIPKVSIQFNNYLDEISVFYVKNNPTAKEKNWDKWEITEKKDALIKTEEFHYEWTNHGQVILESMIRNSSFEFKRNIIHVYIVRAVMRVISIPIIIGVIEKKDRFVSILTHEIIHLLIDDFCQTIGGKKKLLKALELLYPEQTTTTLIHILLYSIHKNVYKDVFKEDAIYLINTDIEIAKKT